MTDLPEDWADGSTLHGTDFAAHAIRINEQGADIDAAQAALTVLQTSGNVDSADIADGTIVLADLVASIQTSLGKADTALQSIATGAVGSAQIADGTVALTDLVTAVQTSLGKADSALQSIGADTIASSNIVNGTIVLADLAAAIQTSLGKADTALQSIATGSVGSTQITDASVALGDLASAVQTSLGKADTALQSVPANSIDSSKVQDGTIALADLTTTVQALINSFTRNIIRQHAGHTLANDTSVHPLFDGSTNGKATLAVGTYRFTAVISITAMSATLGNGAFSLVAADSAVLANVLYYDIGRDGSINTVASLDGFMSNTAAESDPSHSSQTSTAVQLFIVGSFEVTTAGTVAPSYQQHTATASASVVAGSFFECVRIGEVTDVALPAGVWS